MDDIALQCNDRKKPSRRPAMGSPRRERPAFPVLAMWLTGHCDTYDSFLVHTCRAHNTEDALRPKHRAHKSTEHRHKICTRNNRLSGKIGGFPLFSEQPKSVSGRKTRNQGPDRDKQKTQIVGTESSRNNVGSQSRPGGKGLDEDLWMCFREMISIYSYKYRTCRLTVYLAVVPGSLKCVMCQLPVHTTMLVHHLTKLATEALPKSLN